MILGKKSHYTEITNYKRFLYEKDNYEVSNFYHQIT